MAGFNGTGPNGMGPMTGKGNGRCIPNKNGNLENAPKQNTEFEFIKTKLEQRAERRRGAGLRGAGFGRGTGLRSDGFGRGTGLRGAGFGRGLGYRRNIGISNKEVLMEEKKAIEDRLIQINNDSQER